MLQSISNVLNITLRQKFHKSEAKHAYLSCLCLQTMLRRPRCYWFCDSPSVMGRPNLLNGVLQFVWRKSSSGKSRPPLYYVGFLCPLRHWASGRSMHYSQEGICPMSAWEEWHKILEVFVALYEIKQGSFRSLNPLRHCKIANSGFIESIIDNIFMTLPHSVWSTIYEALCHNLDKTSIGERSEGVKLIVP